jgi:hypothetical protein
LSSDDEAGESTDDEAEDEKSQTAGAGQADGEGEGEGEDDDDLDMEEVTTGGANGAQQQSTALRDIDEDYDE